MTLVVFVKGVNVGGHRRFRPTQLTRELSHLDPVNVGAAGTFVIRGRVRKTDLYDVIAARLPFEAQITICRGSEVTDLLSHDFFMGHRSRPDIVRFVGVLPGLPDSEPALPLGIPARTRWLVQVLARHGRFVIGLHRRKMQAIGALGRLEDAYGLPATIRSWSTLQRIGGVLERSRIETGG